MHIVIDIPKEIYLSSRKQIGLLGVKMVCECVPFYGDIICAIAKGMPLSTIDEQMRDATKEEQESVDNYITSISTSTIPLSVIEDIKTEIKQKREENRNGEYDKIFELCLLIIDKHTSGKRGMI